MEFIRKNKLKETSTISYVGGGGSSEGQQIIMPETDPSKWENVEDTDYIQPKDGKGVYANDVAAENLIANNGNIKEATIENLTVTGAAHFFELVIDKVKSVGGQMILSPTHAKIDKVMEGSIGAVDVFRIYYKATDGESQITNRFQSGDLILCQTFNAATGTSYDVSNKFYWARVVSSSSTVDSEGYWTVSVRRSGFSLPNDGTWAATNCNGVPEARDEIVVVGNATDSSRQNAIIINSADSEFLQPKYNGQTVNAPSITTYKGINTYSLDDKQDTIISANLNVFKGDFYSTNGKSIIEQIDDKLDLYASKDDLETAGIHIDGANSSINMTANNLTLTNVDGETVLSADNEGNLVINGEINADSGTIGGGKIQNNQLVNMNQIIQKYTTNLVKGTTYLNNIVDITKTKFNFISADGRSDIYLPTYQQLQERFGITNGTITAPLGFKLYACKCNRTYQGSNASISVKTAINTRQDFVNFYGTHKGAEKVGEGTASIMLLLVPDVAISYSGYGTIGYFPSDNMVSKMFREDNSDDYISGVINYWSDTTTVANKWITAVRKIKPSFQPTESKYFEEVRCNGIDRKNYEGKVLHVNWYKGIYPSTSSGGSYTKRNTMYTLTRSTSTNSTLDIGIAACGIWCETSEGRYDITPPMFDYILTQLSLSMVTDTINRWHFLNTEQFELPTSIDEYSCFECTIIGKWNTSDIYLYSDSAGSQIVDNDASDVSSIRLTQGDTVNFLVTLGDRNNVAVYYILNRQS